MAAEGQGHDMSCPYENVAIRRRRADTQVCPYGKAEV